MDKSFNVNNIIDCMKLGKRTEAEALISHYLENKPHIKADWLKVSALSLRIGEVDMAKQAAELFHKSCPQGIDTDLHYAGLYAEAGDLGKALAIIEPYISAGEKHPAIFHMAGTMYAQLGRIDEAKRALIFALDLAPHLGISWFTLASIINFKQHANLLRNLQLAYQNLNADDKRNEQQFLYALGKAYDDVGDYEQAWQYYAKGANIMAQLANYSSDIDANEVDAIIGNFSLDKQKQLPYSRSSYRRSIAVLGLPRSGTTLLGQMLSCHSSVAGAGEFNGIGVACMHLQGKNFLDFPAYIANHGHPVGAIDHIATVYQKVADLQFKAKGYIVDKSLNLNRYFGIWAQAFPNSKAIYIRRNDNDTAWSCFKTNFRAKAAWSWSAESIFGYISSERRLLEHWKRLFSKRILEVNYEDLVAKPEATLTKICAHLGINYESNMLSFYNSSSPVFTSSVGQVHQPLQQIRPNLVSQYPEFFAGF
ncbi:tetratricopeptide repeat-containing sulfotransferase family protein [Rheinheimera metallidurans]|uniref:tetratricopeptide repeat-containing sulfotransferase family protein n=1 Tax=Rheinheimera metallidurans TaxID=2925781 RepID=UPI003001F573